MTKRHLRSTPKRGSGDFTSPRDRRLGIECLEPRLLLDGDGFISGNDVYLTLSFAPDDTNVANQSNALAATFDAIAPTSVWEDAILRAFQTWAVETNGDIGVVSDSGDAFGSPGPSQNDDRFGDIRIGAIAMSPEVGAVSVAVDGLVSGTWFADVVFNTAFNYQTLDDIFAVALHEAGHVFGLEDSADSTSPMFTGGTPTGLPPTAIDLATLQQLHGIRMPDSNESDEEGGGGPLDNDSIANATSFKLVENNGANEGSAPSIVYGDITDNLDRDIFELKTPGDYTGPATIQVRTSGISLLAPTVNVYDETEQLISQAVSTSTSGDWLTLTIPAVVPDETYYIEVTGTAAGIFGIGGFSLVATFDGINEIDQLTIDSIAGGQFRFLEQDDFEEFFDADDDDFFNDDLHSDDTSTSATDLKTTAGFVEATRYEVVASIVDATDVDFYGIKSPSVLPVPLDVLTVLVRSLDAGGLIPTASILDSNGLPIASTILANGGGEYIIQFDGVNFDTNYQVKVEAADNGGLFNTGNYSLTVSFGSQTTQMTPLSTGVVGNGTTQNIHTLYIGQPQLFHIALEVDPAATTSPTAVVVTIKNDVGEVVYQIAAGPGETRSREAVFLSAGSYTVEVVPLTLDGSVPPSLSYSLLGSAISDPFVGDPDDPTNNPFACTEPGMEGFFCYPGDFVSPDPFLWDDFIDSLTDPPDIPNLPTLITFIFGDWWTWVWNQTGVNGPPFGLPDTAQVPESSSSASASLLIGPTGSVLDNDIDPENDLIVAILQTGPSDGTLNLATDGTFVYTPNLGFRGRDAFTYTAFDFSQESASATVSIIVGESGDFSADGTASGTDFLTWQLNFGTTTGAVLTDGDSNFDGDVDSQDLGKWKQQFGLLSGAIPSYGDADADGDIDGIDFLAWQSGFGSQSGASSSSGDADADSDVDAVDFVTWKSNFGTVSAAAAAASTASVISISPISVDSSAEVPLNASQEVLSPGLVSNTVSIAVPVAVQPDPAFQELSESSGLSDITFLESPYAKAFATNYRQIESKHLLEVHRQWTPFTNGHGKSFEVVDSQIKSESSSENSNYQSRTDARDHVFAEFSWDRFQSVRATLLAALNETGEELDAG